ncbi:hypothetical protein FRB93_011203 [Tulasnella sp. JGI-2019a]|nr:hypothetical protein FRB93_011203 [Tulasnella sp. JGI-2019a]
MASTSRSSSDAPLPFVPSLAEGEPSSPFGATRLQPRFFASELFCWFHLQFPLFDLQELPSHFNAIQSSTPLERGLYLINHTLLAWATSFGLNENGCGMINVDVDEGAIIKDRRETSNMLVGQCLKMVERMGMLRKMSFDSTRAVLLLMPLTKGMIFPPRPVYILLIHSTDVMFEADREPMHYAALQQAYHLSKLGVSCGVNPIPEDVNAAIKRAPLFWYAHVTEGTTSGLQDKYDSLPLTFNKTHVTSFETSLFTNTFNALLVACSITASLSYEHMIAPTHVAETCRRIHDLFASYSGIETLETQLQKVWSGLRVSWEEFDRLRGSDASEESQAASVDRDVFVSLWQIFIFEACEFHTTKTIQIPMSPISLPDHTIQARLETILSLINAKKPSRPRTAVHRKKPGIKLPLVWKPC